VGADAVTFTRFSLNPTTIVTSLTPGITGQQAVYTSATDIGPQDSGVAGRAITGTTATDTILATDCTKRLDYIGSVAVAITLPTATTLTHTNCVFKVVNALSTNNDLTITTTTWTCNGAATCVVHQGEQAWIYVDSNSATNWKADINNSPLVAGSGIALTRSAHSLSIAAAGATYNPTDLTSYSRLWDFCNSSSATYDWVGSAITSGGATKNNAPAWPDFCGWGLTTGITSGGGEAITVGDTFTITTQVFPPLGANANWTMIYRVKLSATTAVQVYFGFVQNQFAGAVPPASWFGFRFDTVNSLTAFQGEACTTNTCTSTANLATVDTAYHTYKMRSTSAGTILFSVDGGTELSVATNVPTGNVTPFVEALGTGTARTITVGPIAFNATGLSR